MFHAMGPAFIQHYNQKYDLANPWGREWEQQSMAYLHYLLVVQSYNAYHPKFPRSFPAQLQEQCVDRICFNISTPNLFLDPAIQWGFNALASVPPEQPLAGWDLVLSHERARIRQVTFYLCSLP